MQLKINYRKIQTSEQLNEYIENQLLGLTRFMIKDGRWSVEIEHKNSKAHINMKLSSHLGYFTSTSESDDFYSAIDIACDKLVTQIKKKKNQINHHKNPQRSKEGRLQNLNSQLEYFPHLEYLKNKAS